MPPLLFSRLQGLTTHSLAPLATPHGGLSIRQSRLPGPTCSTTPCLSMDGARTSPSAKDTLVKIYELEGHLDFSEGVVFRLQWSWDLKMCPYWRGALILEGIMFSFNGVGTPMYAYRSLLGERVSVYVQNLAITG